LWSEANFRHKYEALSEKQLKTFFKKDEEAGDLAQAVE
jgi:hypothetical protein